MSYCRKPLLLICLIYLDQFQAPFNTLEFDIIGDDSAPSYFSIDASTGSIFLRNSISTDSADVYYVRVRVQDGGNPRLSDITQVLVFVNRNLFAPVFVPQQYSDTILDTQPVGLEILRITATDQDSTEPHNVVRYELRGDALDLQYFMVDDVTGSVMLRQSVYESQVNTQLNSFSFQGYAYDLGTPTRRNSTILANIFINVIRNNFPPVFISEPYSTQIPESQQAFTSVFRVTATDADTTDPFNRITYDLIGDDGTPSYFTINDTTGIISLRPNTNLEFDDTVLFVARVRASDGGFPSRTDTATVSISVLRNLFSPQFNHTGNIQVTIPETSPIGTFIFDLDAFDNDMDPPENTVTYQISSFTNAGFFLINPTTGVITLLQSVLNTGQDFYRLSVTAQDGGTPMRSATIFVDVTVLRESGTLRFSLPSYETTIAETRPVDDVIIQTVASPGPATYSIISSEPSSTYFSINSATGAITVRQDLRSDPSYLTFYRLVFCVDLIFHHS